MNLFGDSLKKKLKDAEVEVRKPALFYEGDLYFQITVLCSMKVICISRLLKIEVVLY